MSHCASAIFGITHGVPEQKAHTPGDCRINDDNQMKGSPALAVAGGCRVATGLRKLSQDRFRRLGGAHHCDQSLKFLFKIRAKT
jgi:hypothetical protein